MSASSDNVNQDPQQADSDAGHWRKTKRLRGKHRAWVIIWLARAGCYRAYRRMPGARRDTALSAATAHEMASRIRRAERAAARRARHALRPS
jgi:hypothetical protein